MAEHEVKVVTLTVLYQAQCKCGWKGWARSKRDVAFADAAEHERNPQTV